MKPIRSILTASVALALFTTTLQAEVFPIFEDTVGSPVTNTIAKAAGVAKTMAISGKSTAYIGFAVGQSGIDPDTVTAARLTIYFSTVTKPGTISLHQLTSGFTESFIEPKRPAPTRAAAFDSIPLTTALARDFFIIDVTNEVKAWLSNPASDFGLAITGDATVACIIASKEGAASGHPAIIEIDVNRPGGTVAGTSASFTGNVTGGSFNANGTFTGASANFFGNIGIGTSNPDAPLDVRGGGKLRVTGTGLTASVDLTPFDPAGTNDPATRIQGTDDGGFGGHLDFLTKPIGAAANTLQQRMRITSVGNIGMGTTNPQANLHVQRNMTGSGQESPFRITKGNEFDNIFWMRTFGDGLPVNMELFEGDAFKPGGGAWGVVSDRRLKKDIEPLKGALAKVLELNSVTYQYKEPAKVGQFPGTQIGFIAQEVEEVFPEWITVNADGFKTVNIRGFESLTVQALRELREEKDAEIAALKAENRALAAKMASFDEQLTALKASLDDRPARTVRAAIELK